MAAAYVKSVFYLGGFGFLGYMLMIVTEPNEAKKRAIAGTGYQDPQSKEVKTQKALFLEKIKEATTDTPIYLKKKELPSQPSKREIN